MSAFDEVLERYEQQISDLTRDLEATRKALLLLKQLDDCKISELTRQLAAAMERAEKAEDYHGYLLQSDAGYGERNRLIAENKRLQSELDAARKDTE
jgi:hypothetical protein